MKRGHELASEALPGKDRRGEDQNGSTDHDPRTAGREADDRSVQGTQDPVHRVSGFGTDPAADQVAHQDRDQGDRQERRAGHGEGLRIGERFEEAALLLLQREHRQEAERDDEEGEEERRPDLTRTRGYDLPAGRARLGPLQVLVHVLDHHDGAVHHGADRDRDPTKAHDVRVHSDPAHHDEGDENADGQRDDRHERRAEVEEENDGYGRHDQGFLEQLVT